MVFLCSKKVPQNLNIFLNFDFKSSLSHENLFLISIFTEEKHNFPEKYNQNAEIMLTAFA